MLARGRSSATTTELADLLRVPADVVRVRLHPYVQRGEWVSPARGLWIPVPLEYRLWGAPPGIDIIDAMMGHLRVPYYVGWLAAAELYGAAHHAPQVFQVAVGHHVGDRQVGRTRFRFATRTAVTLLPTTQRVTRTGHATVSTREITMLDIAADVAIAAGLDNAATTIVGLAEDDLDVAALARWSTHFPASAVRRLGWILHTHSDRTDLDPLHRAAAARREAPSLLSPTGPRSGPIDRRWSLQINAEIDVEF
jgi:predicted transcriptional regulator of viral defense system